MATYTSSSASVANTNPIILDSKGEADIWVVGQIKVNVLQSDDTQVTGWPVDNIGSGVSNNDAQMRWGGTATGTANALAIAPSPSITEYVTGQSFVFKSSASPNTTATTISVSGLAAIAVQINGAACSGGEIQADKWYMIVLSSTTVAQLSPIGNTGVIVADAAADTTTWPMLATSQTGNQQPTTDAGLTYNASTNELTVGTIALASAASTWTPVLTFAVPGDLARTYSSQLGTYTKIGNKVFADLFLATATFTHTTASGQLQITGLPFAAGAVKYNNLNFGGITKAGYTVITGTTSAASTVLLIEASGSGVAPATVTTADCPTGGTMILRGQIIYTV